MGSEVPLSIFALAFLVLSIPLLAGRGSWLVAGYNTMTPSQRAQYDERKLCRATGCMLLGVSIAFSLMACAAVLEAHSTGACGLADWLNLFAVVALIVDVVAGVWYVRAKCFRS
ncbi:MAG: DUF3784 domain-containing protein [Collinsella phocaeensis]|uniref:DUF3784 domain-containing protein n=1 Tax=Collinsella phocaeensis TaxID=1871016 RepID=UPI00093003A9|nr:DUF3784 domain-containing protein [Collinsella phocaeensis]